MGEKITVIVPVYNVENYLQQCLDSLLAQTYKNLEIIVVNDGSTDNSGNICQEYVQKDNRIIYIETENSGQSAAIMSLRGCTTFIYLETLTMKKYMTMFLSLKTYMNRQK